MPRSIGFILILLVAMGVQPARAQYEAFQHTAEIGVSLGAASYFGDLNTTGNITHSKISAGGYYKRMLNDYVDVRLQGQYALVGYSDIYSKNEFQHTRNLSFNSNIWEATLQGDFNFFRFNPVDPEFRFTPYLTFGAGAFKYNPYAYLNGQKYYLRPLHTEGQGLPGRPKPYGDVAACFPIGIGLKWALNENMNLGVEVVYRFTTTGYLDDVHGTYAGAAAFPPGPNGTPSVAYLLQDRSYVYGPPIGEAGRERGTTGTNDSYAIGVVSLSININTYHCPPVWK